MTGGVHTGKRSLSASSEDFSARNKFARMDASTEDLHRMASASSCPIMRHQTEPMRSQSNLGNLRVQTGADGMFICVYYPSFQ